MRRLLFFLVWSVAAAPALADTRAAFVVGNADYEHTAPLSNPVRDAVLVGTTLGNLGFEVSLHQNLTGEGFVDALSDFLDAYSEADLTLFYFAGHGIQVDGRNYLLGTDAALRSEFDLRRETIELDAVVEALERRSNAALVFVDACRDNPLADSFYRENFPQTRSAGTRGLAPVQSTHEGTMLVFSASPGQVAYDGTGANSPFSLALARHLPAENVEILSLMKRVIRDVRGLTRGLQSPVITNDLASDVYLREAAVSPPAAVTDPLEEAVARWADFRSSRSPDALEAFATEFEGTPYAALAREQAARLRSSGGEPLSGGDQNPLPERLPDWCSAPRNRTEETTCTDPELLALDEEFSRRMEAWLSVSAGAARGQALIAKMTWRDERAACGADAACIRQTYRLQQAALVEFAEEELPEALIRRSIQEELNRLGCGAGTPDGEDGPRTRRAISLLSSVSTSVPADAPTNSPETLEALRSLPSGVCSLIARAQTDPGLLAGAYDVTQDCPPLGTDLERFTLRLQVDGRGLYSGRYTRIDGWSRVVGGRLGSHDLTLTHVTAAGHRTAILLSPAEDPDLLTGKDNMNCEVVASKR